MNPLVTEIARLVDNTKDVTFRIGTAVDTTTVQIHDNTQIKVSLWSGYPGAGGKVLLLMLTGSVIGFGLSGDFTSDGGTIDLGSGGEITAGNFTGGDFTSPDGGTFDAGEYGTGMFDYLDSSAQSYIQVLTELDLNLNQIMGVGSPTLYSHGALAATKAYVDGKDLTPDSYKFYNDFIMNPVTTNVGDNTLVAFGVGTGTGSSARSGYTNRIGVCRFNTGTTATGYMTPSSPYSNVTISGTTQFWIYEGDFYILDLSTAAEEFNCRFGFGDSSTNNAHTRGMYFLYDRAGGVSGGAASANWKCVVSGITNSVTVTSVPVAAATWFRLKITVDTWYSPDKVTFYINGTQVHTTMTDTPTGLSYSYHFGFGIIKTVGVTARNVDCDWLKVSATGINR